MSRIDKVMRKLTDHETIIWNALQLAKAGMHVFPLYLVDPHLKDDGGIKATKDYRGLAWSKYASCDAEVVFDLFEQRPGSVIGIATGPSGIVVIDVDKNGDKDGDASLAEAGVVLPTADLSYQTIGGGTHHYYPARKSKPVKMARDVAGPDGKPLEGVDVRAIGSMVVYYGPRLEAPPELHTKAPDWLPLRTTTDAAKAAEGRSFSDITSFYRPGDQGPTVRAAVKAVKRQGMHHDDALALTNALAKLGAEGMSGVREAMAEARERWASEHGPKHYAEWDIALLDAVQHFGHPLPMLADPIRLMHPTPAEAVEQSIRESEIEAHPVAAPVGPLVPIKDTKRPKLPRSTPDDFIRPRDGLDSALLAQYTNQDGHLGVGIDGRYYEYRGGVWQENDDAIRNRVVRLMGSRYRRDHVAIARDVVAADPDTTVIDGEPHEQLINTRNGMLDWRTGTLLPHSPAYRSTVQLAVEYTPGAPTPLFDQWLELVCADSPDLAITLWEVLAYAVYNGNPFQQAVMLHGKANAGKSAYIRLVEHMVGRRNVAHLTPEQMEERFPKAELHGKLLNTQGEYEGKRLTSTNSFKSIVGGDMISAEHKGKRQFEFRPWAFHIFAGNEFDISSDTTEGYYRRWLVIDFTRRIRDLVPFTEADFQHEAGAVFSRAVALLPALIGQGKFTETIHSMTATARMRIESDMAALWLENDEHVTIHDPETPVTTRRSHLYTVYKDWSESNGHRAMSSQTLYRRLERMGYLTFKRSVMTIRGISVDTVPLNALGFERTESGEDDGQA